MTTMLLTLEEAAARLSCSPRTLRRRIRRGELSVFRDHGLLRIDERELTRYVAAHTITAPAHTTATLERRAARRLSPRIGSLAQDSLPADRRVRTLFDEPDPLPVSPA